MLRRACQATSCCHTGHAAAYLPPPACPTPSTSPCPPPMPPPVPVCPPPTTPPPPVCTHFTSHAHPPNSCLHRAARHTHTHMDKCGDSLEERNVWGKGRHEEEAGRQRTRCRAAKARGERAQPHFSLKGRATFQIAGRNSVKALRGECTEGHTRRMVWR